MGAPRHGAAPVCAALLLAGAVAAQDAFRLEREALVVDAADHWRRWSAPLGGPDLSDPGVLRPRFLRRDTDALPDAEDFLTVLAGGDTIRGGVQAAGANFDMGRNVFDGDPATFWEPDVDLPLSEWYLEINIGRSVIARQVRVRFVDAGLGDPFLKFRVLLSDGTVTDETGRERGLRFFRAGQVARRNEGQREFLFDVAPRRPAGPGVTGEVAQVVRFEALGTDGLLAEQVSADAYAALPAADRGAVQHFRQTVAGRLILVDEDTWEGLSPDFKGPVHYWRRERPRLATVEVLTPGDNIVALTQRLQSRNSDLFRNIVRNLSTDGIFASFYPLRVYDPLRDENQVEVDLGARYWIDRVRLLSPREPLTAYQVRLSDGSRDPAGVRAWTALDERINANAHLQLEETFEPRQVRFIELRRLEAVGSVQETGTVSEIQAYGEGYLADVTLESPVLRLPGTRLFTTVDWDAAGVPPGTSLEIRTRSGDSIVQLRRYFDRFGREVGEDEYNVLTPNNRGDRTVEDLPGGDWSTWSQAYLAPGQAFRSPSPRRMLMVQVRMLTSDPGRAPALRALRLGLAPPLVQQIFAEVVPKAGVLPGEDQDFVMHVRPEFQFTDAGFDRLRLRSSSAAPIDLRSVSAGSAEQLRQGSARRLFPGLLERRDGPGGAVDVLFPEPVTAVDARIYELRFRTRVFLNGTALSASVLHSDQPGVEQQASDGDATSQLRSETTVVLADVQRSRLLGRLRAVPPVVTPNGDGVNDVTQLTFPVFLIKGGRRFDVQLFDLAGRRVRDLSLFREPPSGLHAVPWDGRDDEGRLVPPGLYVARVGFATDTGAPATSAVATVHVAY